MGGMGDVLLGDSLLERFCTVSRFLVFQTGSVQGRVLAVSHFDCAYPRNFPVCDLYRDLQGARECRDCGRVAQVASAETVAGAWSEDARGISDLGAVCRAADTDSDSVGTQDA